MNRVVHWKRIIPGPWFAMSAASRWVWWVLDYDDNLILVDSDSHLVFDRGLWTDHGTNPDPRSDEVVVEVLKL